MEILFCTTAQREQLYKLQVTKNYLLHMYHKYRHQWYLDRINVVLSEIIELKKELSTTPEF